MSSATNKNTANPLDNSELVDEPVRDAASVILLREMPDRQPGLQSFMLRRSGSTTVMNSAYVFPGGKVDADDASADAVSRYGPPGDAPSLINEPSLAPEHAAALFVAACRECEEECGVTLTASQLMPFSRWITPKTPAMMRRRFDTRFFVAFLPEGAEAVHDGQEADHGDWMSPRRAIDAYCSGEIVLAPPQIMSLAFISRFDDYGSLREALTGHLPPLIEPQPFKEASGARSLAYPGDPEHPVSTPAFPGPTRLVWRDGHFEPQDGPAAFFERQR